MDLRRALLAAARQRRQRIGVRHDPRHFYCRITRSGIALRTPTIRRCTTSITQLSTAITVRRHGVKTYIIGVGAGVDPAANPAAAARSRPWPSPAAPDSNAISRRTARSKSTNDLQIIITKILAATQSTASAAVNSTGLNTDSVVYQSQFTTSDTYQDWTGNLFAYPIDLEHGHGQYRDPQCIWSAQTQLDAQTGTAGSASSRPGTPVGRMARHPVSMDHGHARSPASPAAPRSGTSSTTFTADTNGQDVLQFLRGSQRSGAAQRRPVPQSHPPAGRHRRQQVRSTSARRARPIKRPPTSRLRRPTRTAQPVIYVGANDGMLHAFDARPPLPHRTGNELFAYIPHGVFANLIKLVNPYYNAAHQFYVNGSPQASDVQFADMSWHTVLVGVEGAGGNSVFALDVTNPAAITNEVGAGLRCALGIHRSRHGLGFSTPAIANTASGWTVFVGNGYNSPNAEAVPLCAQCAIRRRVPVNKIDLCAAGADGVQHDRFRTACRRSLPSTAAVSSRRQCEHRLRGRFAGQSLAGRCVEPESRAVDGDGPVPGHRLGAAIRNRSRPRRPRR